jgi:hypothetical protein
MQKKGCSASIFMIFAALLSPEFFIFQITRIWSPYQPINSKKLDLKIKEFLLINFYCN